MQIKDSGERRQFESGAVRDITEGKGRCDLLPLDVIADMLGDEVLAVMGQFMEKKTPELLEIAAITFDNQRGVSHYMSMLDYAVHLEAGAKKYNERNWEKGIPVHCFIDSGIRHYLKYRDGWTDEPHAAAFTWNIIGAMWTMKHHPECMDI